MTTVFELLIGLAVFLYGMSQLELAARNLSGHRLRQWLQRSTSSPLLSAGTGVILTAIVQSSSLVSLIVLAFASAGVIPLINAIGVVIGANLGTTLTGWLVTLLGFKLDLENIALPLLAAGGLAQAIIARTRLLRDLGLLILGLGLLLFGLTIMKDTMADLPQQLNFDSLQGYPAVTYLVIGTALTALIQSSSAMMMVALTALNSGLIALPEAAALVIGADLGTTSTVILGSLTGHPVKKQLALAHCVFNLAVDACAFLIFLPLLPALLNLINISDPLFGLVAFHSFFNLVGMIVVLPFLAIFTDWISSFFKTPQSPAQLLQGSPTAVPETAIPLVIEAIRQLWWQGLKLNLSHFHLRLRDVGSSEADSTFGDFEQEYETLKNQEAGIIEFVARLQQESLTPEQSVQLTALIEVSRAIVYSSKTLKDIRENLASLCNSNLESLKKQYYSQKQYAQFINEQLFKKIANWQNPALIQEQVQELLKNNDLKQIEYDQRVYHNSGGVSGPRLSTQLNVNREIHHATKTLLLVLERWNELMAEN